MLPRFYKSPTLWLGLALFLFAALFRAAIHFHKFDDAFITFRYARNLIEGHGFVYNPGERVLGTTTPLFTLLLAAAGFLFHTTNLPLVADWINRLADGGSAVLLFLLALRVWGSRPLALLLGLFFALSYHSVFFASTGMETSLFTFLVLFALERLLAGRLRPALLLAALALMTRPDALLLFAAIALYLLFTRQRPRPVEFLPAAALLALYAGALWLYFGSVVPHSMLAKSILCPSTDRFRLFSLPNWYNVMMFWSGFLAKTHYQQFRPNVLLALPTVLLFAAGCVELARRSPRALLLPGFGLFFFAAYAKSMVFMFPWYLIPTVPALLFTLFAGLKFFSDRLLVNLRLDPRRGTVALAAAVLAGQSLAFVSPSIIPSAIARTMYPTHLEQDYRQAIGIVMARQKPPLRILTPEIGFIGYYGGAATIIDAGGLTCPALVRFHKTHPGFMKNNELVNGPIIDAFQPDWIITLRTFFDESLPLDPGFVRHYEAVPAPADSIEKVLIFRRR